MLWLLIILLLLSSNPSFSASISGAATGGECETVFDPFGEYDNLVVVYPTTLKTESGITTIPVGSVGAVDGYSYALSGKCFLRVVALRRADAREENIISGELETGDVSDPYRKAVPYKLFSCDSWSEYISRDAKAVIISPEGYASYSSGSEAGDPGEYNPGVFKPGKIIDVKGYSMKSINGKTYCLVESDGGFHFSGTAEEGDIYIVPILKEWMVEKVVDAGTIENTGRPVVHEECSRIAGTIYVDSSCTIEKALEMVEDGDKVVIREPGTYQFSLKTDKSFSILSDENGNYVLKSDGTLIESTGDVEIEGFRIIAKRPVKAKYVRIYDINASYEEPVEAETVVVVSSSIDAENAIKGKDVHVVNSYLTGTGKGIEADFLSMYGSIITGFGKCVEADEASVIDSTFQNCNDPNGFALKARKGTVYNTLFLANSQGIVGGKELEIRESIFLGNNVGVEEGAVHDSSFYGNQQACSPLVAGRCKDRCRRSSRFLVFGFNGFKTSECPFAEAVARLRDGDEIRIDSEVRAVPIKYPEGIFVAKLRKGSVLKGNGGKIYVPMVSSGIYVVEGKLEKTVIEGQFSYGSESVARGRHVGVEIFGGLFNEIKDSDISGFNTGIKIFSAEGLPESIHYYISIKNTNIHGNGIGIYAEPRDVLIVSMSKLSRNGIGLLMRKGKARINFPQLESISVEGNGIGILLDPLSKIDFAMKYGKVVKNGIGIYINNTNGNVESSISDNKIKNNNIGIKAEKPDGISINSNIFDSNNKNCEGISCG